jgi:hypothetical protein
MMDCEAIIYVYKGLDNRNPCEELHPYEYDIHLTQGSFSFSADISCQTLTGPETGRSGSAGEKRQNFFGQLSVYLSRLALS